MPRLSTHSRRHLLGAAGLALAATPIGLTRFTAGAFSVTSQTTIPAISPGTHTSFAALKQIDAGVLNVSKAKRILPVVDKQTDLWISKAASLPQRELEREVVQSQPRKFIRDSVRAVSSDQVEIRCEGSHALEQKLYRLREVLSRKMAKYPSLGEALDAAAEFFLEKNDPLRKAARVSVKSANSPSGKKSAQPPSGRLRTNPRFIPAAVRHEVQLRDQGRCRFSTHGKRCTSRAFVDIHHVRPVSAGGASSSSNLLTLCTSHHRAIHDLGLWPAAIKR